MAQGQRGAARCVARQRRWKLAIGAQRREVSNGPRRESGGGLEVRGLGAHERHGKGQGGRVGGLLALELKHLQGVEKGGGDKAAARREERGGGSERQRARQ